MRRTRVALIALALVAAAYPLAALQTPPGFYEGFCPPVDYQFLNPPSGVKTSKPPVSGHAEIKVIGGVVQPGFVVTGETNPQAQLSFVPGAFAPPPSGSEVIDIKPVSSYPDAKGIAIVTNVYQITSSTPMVKASNLRLLYSTVLPAPSSIYTAQSGGSWTALNSNPSTATGCSDIVAQVSSTGLFMAGYQSGSTRPGGATTIGGGQLLPIIVALAILIVVLAGVPLAVMRRRRPPGGGEDKGGSPPART
ncbi:MAG: hypothetical protein M3Z98_03540 [Candidatus Dormibacteraeota bacterium]|nr:hypothetical protein [Candidatus Dormibacteraeota bacterium]